jgi:hypothetical protein
MRLLQLDHYPSFSLTEFAEDEIPRYAILSHTWADDGDEVTYKDIIDGMEVARLATTSSTSAQSKPRMTGWVTAG